MYTHRGAYLNALGEVIETGMSCDTRLPLDAADVPLQRLVLPLGGHGGRRHARLPAQGRAGPHLGAARAEGVTHYCGAPTVLIALVEPPGKARRSTAHGDRDGGGRAALADAARPAERAELRPDPRLRPDRDLRAAHDLRVAAASGTSCPREEQARLHARQGQGYADRRPGARGRRADARRAARRRDARRGGHARQQRDEGLLRAARGDRRGLPRRLVPLGRPRRAGTPTATSSCATARRTSSSPAARTSRRSRSSRRSRGTRPCWSAPSSPSPTRTGASGPRRS